MHTTPCQCERPGWCERHGMNKSPHLHMLCRNNQRYFDAWEAGIGPGQNIDPNERSQQVPREGVGWEMLRVLYRFGIHSRSKGCGCSDKLGFMNKWGVDACVARIPTIVAWLAKEAKSQQQPFCERKARTLVRLAIRNTRLALENSPAERASCANNP